MTTVSMPHRPKKVKAGNGLTPSWLSRDWLWALLLLLGIFFAYSPVWWAGYIWDDDLHLTSNLCIIGPYGLKEIWTTNAARICPLVLTTFWFEHALWGLAPLPYHIVNVLMHGAGAIVLWRVLRRLQVPGAWLGAALWAFHPVQVESAAWITEMKNTESGVFYLLSILFFVRWLRPGDSGERIRGNWNYGMALIFAAMAMASKSSTVILPLVLCLCAWWTERRWHWRNLATVGPIFLMSLIATAVSVWTQKLEGGIDPSMARSWPERFATAGREVWFYLGKLLWPHPLMAIYPRWQVDPAQVSTYLPLLAVVLLFILLWLKRDSWFRAAFFAFAYFLVALLPELGLVDHYFLQYSFVADHFQYLASMGPLALAGAGMAWVGEFILHGKRLQQVALAACVLLILAVASWQRAWAYESEETLWIDTLAKNPQCWVAYNNLGMVYQRRGQMDDAIDYFQKALQLNPNYTQAHINLGSSLAQKGQVDAAILQYRQAAAVDPNRAEIFASLGNALFQKGQVDDAIAEYQQALKLNPNLAGAYIELGDAFSQKGQVSDATASYEKALFIDPTSTAAHNNLGNLLMKSGQMDDAIAQFQDALKTDPGNLDTHYNLGLAFLRKGDGNEAIAEFTQVLRANPADAEAQGHLAQAQSLTRQK